MNFPETFLCSIDGPLVPVVSKVRGRQIPTLKRRYFGTLWSICFGQRHTPLAEKRIDADRMEFRPMQNEKPHVDWIVKSPVQNTRRPVGWIFKAMLGVGCAFVTAAILYPVFAVSRGGSHRSCLSNVKQLGLAFQMYVEDYDGRFPRSAEWMDSTYPYNKNKSVYHCPSLQATHPSGFGYAFNSSLALHTLDKNKTAAKVVVLYDASDLLWNANAPGRAGMANPPRHQGGNNVGFADGHAKWQSLISGEN